MRKVLLCLGIICTSVLVFLSFNFKQSNTLTDYKATVGSINNIEPTEFISLIKDRTKDKYVFFGRETCPYCVDFLSKKSVKKFFKENNVYYIDTENTDKSKLLKSIREQYDIEFVPSLLHISKENINKMNIDNL